MYIDKWLKYIWARWVVEIMKIWKLILIVSIVKILVWKPNSFLVFYFILFISITLVGLHNTHVLNYTRNTKNKNKNLHTKYQKTFSSSFLRSLPNTGKLYSFLENTLWKMNHFPENVYVETNKALNWFQALKNGCVDLSLVVCFWMMFDIGLIF